MNVDWRLLQDGPLFRPSRPGRVETPPYSCVRCPERNRKGFVARPERLADWVPFGFAGATLVRIAGAIAAVWCSWCGGPAHV